MKASLVKFPNVHFLKPKCQVSGIIHIVVTHCWVFTCLCILAPLLPVFYPFVCQSQVTFAVSECCFSMGCFFFILSVRRLFLFVSEKNALPGQKEILLPLLFLESNRSFGSTSFDRHFNMCDQLLRGKAYLLFFVSAYSYTVSLILQRKSKLCRKLLLLLLLLSSSSHEAFFQVNPLVYLQISRKACHGELFKL